MSVRCWLDDPQFSTRFGCQADKFGGRQAICRLHVLEMNPHIFAHRWNLFCRPPTKETTALDQLDQQQGFGREPHINGVEFRRKASGLQLQRPRVNLVKMNIVQPIDVDSLGLDLFDHLIYCLCSLCRVPVLLRDKKWRLALRALARLPSMAFLDLDRMSIGTKDDKAGFGNRSGATSCG